MGTTPNYGWDFPDPTDLVKDLPADFETFADAVDDRVKLLNPETTQGDISFRGATANAKTRLGIGTAGQVLTVNSGATAPEWANQQAALTQLATGSLSGAQVDLTGISGSYKNLQLVIRNFIPVSDGARLNLRFNADANTRYKQIRFSSTDSHDAFDQTFIPISNTQDNGTAGSLIVVDVLDYANTATWKMLNHFSLTSYEVTPAEANYSRGNGFYNQTGAITQINLLPSTGNFTSGTYILYGVA